MGRRNFFIWSAQVCNCLEFVFWRSKWLGILQQIIEKSLLADRYLALCTRRDALKELEYIINNDPKKLKKNDMICFFTELIDLSEFYVFLLREDEGIKQCYTVKNKNEIISSLYNSLQWSNPTDILLTKIYSLSIITSMEVRNE